MAAPTMTYNAAGHALSSGSLAAGAAVTFNLDASTDFEVHVEAQGTGGGTVAAVNGLQIDCFRAGDTAINYDTLSSYTTTVPIVSAALKQLTVPLGTGKWQIKLTNLDVTNAITRAAADAYITGVS